MAKISEKSPRFRTKDEICKDLVYILTAELSYGTKFCVVHEITWVWSEFYGKHKGCKYWSINAQKVADNTKGLIHEHIVPRKIIIDHIMNMKTPSEVELFDYLEKNCIGVVVTKEEDKQLNKAGLNRKMPVEWDGQDPWARYKEVGISVLYIENGIGKQIC